MNRIDKVIERCGEASVIEKLAEECSELSAAALKLNCVRRGENPMTELHARANMVGEIADVLVMIRVVRRILNEAELLQINQCASRKEQRMYERLLKEGANG